MSRTTWSPVLSLCSLPSISALNPLLLSLTFALCSAGPRPTSSTLCWPQGFTPPFLSPFVPPFCSLWLLPISVVLLLLVDQHEAMKTHIQVDVVLLEPNHMWFRDLLLMLSEDSRKTRLVPSGDACSRGTITSVHAGSPSSSPWPSSWCDHRRHVCVWVSHEEFLT